MRYIALLFAASLLVVQCKPTDLTDNSNNNTGPVAKPSTDDGVLDRSIPPVAGEAPEIQIGDYDKFTLSNGVEVIVVTNSKLPRVSLSLQLDVDPMLEGDKVGIVGLTGQLLRRGTENRTKAQLDEEVDFIGASLNTSGSGVSGSALSKHQEKLLELMSDVLLNPAFDGDELEKLKKQTISGLATQKDNPNAIAGNVANVLNYGKDHPYGEIESEATIQDITVEDCKNYYNTYFKPNTARLVIVGDVDKAALKKQLESYFGEWQKGKVPAHTYDMPTAPKTAEVAFVDKPGAVQSVINITYPVDFKPGSDDAIMASVMNTILGGGGFSGRLMQNLREDKAYTYGAYSSLSSDELVGSFTASASVRNEVTDSAVTQFLYEMQRLRTEKVDEDHLNLILNKLAGSFSRALERPETVARFAQNIEKYNLPKDYYKTYLKKLRAITPDDIQAMAQKYLRPDNAYILVVGNKDEVADKLKPFAASGQVNFYDNAGAPVETVEIKIDNDVTGSSLLDAYLQKIGGLAAIQAIKTAEIEGTMALDNGLSLSTSQKLILGQKSYSELKMMGNPIQKQVFDGNKLSRNGQIQELDADKVQALRDQAQIINELAYLGEGYSLELKGIEMLDGAAAYKVLVNKPSGEKTTIYFDKTSGLKVKEISSTDAGEQGGIVTTTMLYSDYREVEGVLMPFKQRIEVSSQAGNQNINAEYQSVKFNTTIDESIFAVE